jgi:hypothetical protein
MLLKILENYYHSFYAFYEDFGSLTIFKYVQN